MRHVEIVVCKSLEFDKAKILSSGNGLLLSHTIPTLRKEAL